MERKGKESNQRSYIKKRRISWNTERERNRKDLEGRKERKGMERRKGAKETKGKRLTLSTGKYCANPM